MNCFAEWLKISRPNDRDAVLVFSVSGSNVEKNVSVNLVRAIDKARRAGARVVWHLLVSHPALKIKQTKWESGELGKLSVGVSASNPDFAKVVDRVTGVRRRAPDSDMRACALNEYAPSQKRRGGQQSAWFCRDLSQFVEKLTTIS